jgi:hypothetical protein
VKVWVERLRTAAYRVQRVAFFLKPRKKATATDVDKLQLVGVACAKHLYELMLVSHDKLKDIERQFDVAWRFQVDVSKRIASLDATPNREEAGKEVGFSLVE